MAFDFKKEYKEYYQPPAAPTIVTVPPMAYLAVRGEGDPNAEDGAYQDAIAQLYGVAYTIKMSKKTDHAIEGYFDYVVPPLEGFWWQDGVQGMDYARKADLHWIALLPAAVIMILSICRVSVKPAMAASIAVSVPICIFLQHRAPAELFQMAFTGFRASDAEVASMLNGGGIASMLRVGGIVCLSSSFSGIFRETGLLDGTKSAIGKLAARTGPYAAMLCTSAAASMIACNQTLAIMLTAQLCEGMKKEKHDYALGLEDSAVVIAPLVPWSIAGAVPLTTIGAPLSGMIFACYLYLLPLWRLLRMNSL